MKILYLYKEKHDDQDLALIQETQRLAGHQVEEAKLFESPDYDALLEQMAESDQVITWK